MKAFKIAGISFGSILGCAAIAAIVLAVWANKPRGVKIDIAKLNSAY
ncbi:MAG: hypothetical protein MJ115_00160 [Clostridia bacterium]|nr:hypothetical protein [Clostridia bacterium]